MTKCKGEFWLSRFSELFCSLELIPTLTMSYEQQMNALSRLIILCSIIISLFGVKHSSLFFAFSIILIIILYYAQRNSMSYKEGYKYKDNIPVNTPSIPPMNAPKKVGVSSRLTPCEVASTPLFSDDGYLLTFDQSQYSFNQALVGQSNPKTRKAPVIVPPSYDLSYWRKDGLITNSHINTRTNTDYAGSGYTSSTIYPSEYNPVSPSSDFRGCTVPRKDVVERGRNNNVENVENVENFKYVFDPSITPSNKVMYELPYLIDSPEKSRMSDIVTQIIQPGVYSYNDENEPISSNIGISCTKQFSPMGILIDGGNVSMIQSKKLPIPEVTYTENLGASTVYDPRFTGYSSSDRSYIDKLTGQPRFYYDDVDAIRRPNYLIRSNIDHIESAEHYGPMKPNRDILSNHQDIRRTVQEQFLDDTLLQRTELQERLMRKRNAEMWQLRQAPLSRQSAKRLY